MSARLIAEKLREKPKTLSDHLTKALKQLGECLKLKGLGLPEKMKRDEQNKDFETNIKNQNSIISNSEKRLKNTKSSLLNEKKILNNKLRN